MLINKDPKNAATVKVKITGTTLATNGNRFDYDPKNPPAGYITKGGPVVGLGNEFSIQVEPYSITDVTLPKAQ
jgi:hypothetical protein